MVFSKTSFVFANYSYSHIVPNKVNTGQQLINQYISIYISNYTSAVIIGKNNQREAAINVSPPAEQAVCQPERWSLTYFIRLIINLIHDRLDTLSWSILIVEPNYNKDSFDCWTKITIDNTATMVDLNCWHFVHGEDIDCGYLLR